MSLIARGLSPSYSGSSFRKSAGQNPACRHLNLQLLGLPPASKNTRRSHISMFALTSLAHGISLVCRHAMCAVDCHWHDRQIWRVDSEENVGPRAAVRLSRSRDAAWIPQTTDLVLVGRLVTMADRSFIYPGASIGVER